MEINLFVLLGKTYAELEGTREQLAVALKRIQELEAASAAPKES